MDAWVLDLKPEDKNMVEVLEQGLKDGSIQIPGAVDGAPDGFDGVENVTGYLNTFESPWQTASGISSCRSLILPASLYLMRYWRSTTASWAGRAIPCMMPNLRWPRPSSVSWIEKSVAFIIAECGSGKTKIGSTALGALYGLWASQKRGKKKILQPCHVSLTRDPEMGA